MLSLVIYIDFGIKWSPAGTHSVLPGVDLIY